MVVVARIHYLLRRCPEVLKAVGPIYFTKTVMHSVFSIAAVAAYRGIIFHLQGILDSRLTTAIADEFFSHVGYSKSATHN